MFEVHFGLPLAYLSERRFCVIVWTDGLRLRVGLKDLPKLRTRIHRQILTEVKTFSFYHNTVLVRVTDTSRVILRDVRFLALCSSSILKTMSNKATATAAWDWKDPEDQHQALGPHPISAPHPVPPSPASPSSSSSSWGCGWACGCAYGWGCGCRSSLARSAYQVTGQGWSPSKAISSSSATQRIGRMRKQANQQP